MAPAHAHRRPTSSTVTFAAGASARAPRPRRARTPQQAAAGIDAVEAGRPRARPERRPRPGTTALRFHRCAVSPSARVIPRANTWISPSASTPATGADETAAEGLPPPHTSSPDVVAQLPELPPSGRSRARRRTIPCELSMRLARGSPRHPTWRRRTAAAAARDAPAQVLVDAAANTPSWLRAFFTAVGPPANAPPSPHP